MGEEETACHSCENASITGSSHFQLVAHMAAGAIAAHPSLARERTATEHREEMAEGIVLFADAVMRATTRRRKNVPH